MPETIKLEDGTEREVPTEEEMVEASNRSTARKEQREEVKSELELTQEKLKKLENKEYNFKKLRDMTDIEKEKLSVTEIELKRKQEELEENQKSFTETLTGSFQNEALAVLVGDDKETRKKVLYNFKRISGADGNKEEVFAKMRDAFNMLGSKASGPNPLHSAASYQGAAPGVSKKTEKVDADLAKQFGVTEDDLKNSNLKI